MGRGGPRFTRTPRRKLFKGHRIRESAGKVDDARLIISAMVYLAKQNRSEITRVEAVANLQTRSTEPDVAKRATGHPAVNPIRKNSLVGFSKLTGAGENTAPIDPDRKPKSFAVF
jgi:hypothetical protein